jgi:predicted secreted hydrolase
MGRALALLLALAAVLVGGLGLLGRRTAEPPAATVDVAEALAGTEVAGFARAIAPRAFVFPDDHGPHPGFRAEWWYVTGNVATATGRHFGYQLTLFRNALAPTPAARASAWATTELYMGHFALTDTVGERFHPHVRFARAALGLAGATARPFRVWLEDWALEATGAAPFPARVSATAPDVAIDLLVEPERPPVLHGEDGLSRKSAEPGNASYYYSQTRLATRGQVSVAGQRFDVAGLSWLDREWSTSALGENVGWDWFALQLDDGTDLMVYRLRRPDGTTDRFSAGTLVFADRRTRGLAARDVAIAELAHWTSPQGTRYPARWRIDIPADAVTLEIVPRLADQELSEPVRYWEGAVRVTGTRRGVSVAGAGYVELVGYARRRD